MQPITFEMHPVQFHWDRRRCYQINAAILVVLTGDQGVM